MSDVTVTNDVTVPRTHVPVLNWSESTGRNTPMLLNMQPHNMLTQKLSSIKAQPEASNSPIATPVGIQCHRGTAVSSYNHRTNSVFCLCTPYHK